MEEHDRDERRQYRRPSPGENGREKDRDGEKQEVAAPAQPGLEGEPNQRGDGNRDEGEAVGDPGPIGCEKPPGVHDSPGSRERPR